MDVLNLDYPMHFLGLPEIDRGSACSLGHVSFSSIKTILLHENPQTKNLFGWTQPLATFLLKEPILEVASLKRYKNNWKSRKCPKIHACACKLGQVVI